MSEFKKGYALGKKLGKSECERIVKIWSILEEKVQPILAKKDSDKTEEEKEIESYYDDFWALKVLPIAGEEELVKLGDGFKKAILEKSK
jgi:hypothetical protein